jgi:hypothetical protein
MKEKNFNTENILMQKKRVMTAEAIMEIIVITGTISMYY